LRTAVDEVAPVTAGGAAGTCATGLAVATAIAKPSTANQSQPL